MSAREEEEKEAERQREREEAQRRQQRNAAELERGGVRSELALFGERCQPDKEDVVVLAASEEDEEPWTPEDDWLQEAEVEQPDAPLAAALPSRMPPCFPKVASMEAGGEASFEEPSSPEEDPEEEEVSQERGGAAPPRHVPGQGSGAASESGGEQVASQVAVDSFEDAMACVDDARVQVTRIRTPRAFANVGALVAQCGVGPGPPSVADRPALLRLLLSQPEAGCVLGPRGETLRSIGQSTAACLWLSPRSWFYPGTHLQQLSIWADSFDAALDAALSSVGAIVKRRGVLNGGESNVPIGSARLTVVLPSACVPKLVTLLRKSTGLEVVLASGREVTAGSNPEERLLYMAGPLSGVHLGLQQISDCLSCHALDAR